LGLKNILQAKHIVLLATGIGKQAIVRRAFDPTVPPSVDCPASWLKQHPYITIITDFELGWGFD
jgi:glucosamine-6-phosphate deaminase